MFADNLEISKAHTAASAWPQPRFGFVPSCLTEVLIDWEKKRRKNWLTGVPFPWWLVRYLSEWGWRKQSCCFSAGRSQTFGEVKMTCFDTLSKRSLKLTLFIPSVCPPLDACQLYLSFQRLNICSLAALGGSGSCGDTLGVLMTWDWSTIN